MRAAAPWFVKACSRSCGGSTFIQVGSEPLGFGRVTVTARLGSPVGRPSASIKDRSDRDGIAASGGAARRKPHPQDQSSGSRRRRPGRHSPSLGPSPKQRSDRRPPEQPQPADHRRGGRSTEDVRALCCHIPCDEGLSPCARTTACSSSSASVARRSHLSVVSPLEHQAASSCVLNNSSGLSARVCASRSFSIATRRWSPLRFAPLICSTRSISARRWSSRDSREVVTSNDGRSREGNRDPPVVTTRVPFFEERTSRAADDSSPPPCHDRAGPIQ
jgi:hypothetical protein